MRTPKGVCLQRPPFWVPCLPNSALPRPPALVLGGGREASPVRARGQPPAHSFSLLPEACSVFTILSASPANSALPAGERGEWGSEGRYIVVSVTGRVSRADLWAHLLPSLGLIVPLLPGPF